jgi:hypothetical protein
VEIDNERCTNVDIKMLMLRQNDKERLQIKWGAPEVATNVNERDRPWALI